MTKKRKRYPDLQQKLDRPWCYYCERDFDDLKILISHQKAKHFKCDRCGRRLNTVGGLNVHMNQVHKETLTLVENANPGRQGLDIEIFGMEGVPPEILEQHNQQVTAKHFAEEQERARLSGNPTRGLFTSGTTAPAQKRPRKREDLEEIEKGAAGWRSGMRPDVATVVPPKPVDIPPQFGAPAVQPPAPAYSPPGQGFPPPGAPAYPPGQQFFGGPPAAPPGAFSFAGTPPTGTPSLPSRPPYGASPASQFPGQNGHSSEISSALDELISSATGTAAALPAEAAPKEKSKKEKNVKLIFNGDDESPEELMAQFVRYAGAH